MDDFDRDQHDRFLRLFLENENDLSLFVRSLLFHQEEAREVMQDVAVVLWKKFEADLDARTFRRWAFGVARMEVLSFRRDRARDRHTFGDDVIALLEQDVQGETDSWQAEREALTHCVELLPADHRELVRSAYESGIKKNELASRLGWTSMALYKRLHRIRLQLIDCTRKKLTTGGIA